MFDHILDFKVNINCTFFNINALIFDISPSIFNIIHLKNNMFSTWIEIFNIPNYYIITTIV